MRVTRKLLEELLTDIVSRNGLHLRLDHSSVYGGYMIQEMTDDSGSYRPFITDNRKTASRMYDFMIGYLNGMATKKVG